MGAPSADLMLFIDSPSAVTARAFTYLRTWFEDNNILFEDFFLFFKNWTTKNNQISTAK